MTEARQRDQIAQKIEQRGPSRCSLDAREENYLAATTLLFLPLVDANIINHHLLRELRGYAV
jgi:hypothetical protein